MKTNNEIRIDAIRVLNNIITLKTNVSNGCFSDVAALEIEEKRLVGIKSWAIENNELQAIRQYFASNFFGYHNQFTAVKIAEFFNN